MSQATEKPLEFLREAREAVLKREVLRQETEALARRKQELEERLARTRKRQADGMASAVERRRSELASGYDRQLSQIESRIKKTESARDRAKNQGVRERISEETADLTLANRELKNQLAAVFRKDRVPAFCRTDLYYLLFYPHGVQERLGCLLAFLLVFVGLPIAVFALLPGRNFWYLIPIYLLDVLIFGGLYLKVNNLTKAGHAEALRQGRGIKNSIRANRRKIRAMAHAIKADADEERYDLREFDDELARAKQQLAETSEKKREAMNTFENVTANIISDEIENAGKQELAELEGQLAQTGAELSAAREREDKAVLTLASAYEPYIGKQFMNPESIDRLLGLIQSGQAAGVVEAAIKLAEA